jgi:TolB-like protein/Tfp pilus assembly protein PilF
MERRLTRTRVDAAMSGVRGTLRGGGWLFLLAVCATAQLEGQCPDGTPMPCAGAQPARPVVMIVPFENRSRDTADAYFAETLTEDLAGALSTTHAVRVVGPGSALRATHVIRGSVLRTRETVRVSARIERAGTGEVRWTWHFERPSAEAQALHDSLIDQVAFALGLPARTPRARRPMVDPATYDLWLRAHYLVPRRRQADVAEAAVLLGRALARDSTFAPAWADLARVLQWARGFGFAVPGVPRDSLLPRMLDASERALLLDSANVDTWRLRASVATVVDPTSRRIGLAALQHALALDSLNAETWGQYAMALDETGDSGAAVAAWRRAAALDPHRPLAMYAQHWLWVRQYDSAAAWAEHAVTEDPTLMFLRETVAEVALAQRQLTKAGASYEAALRLGTGPEQVRALGGLAIVAVGAGDTARARNLIARAEAVTDSAAPPLHAAVSIAEAYVAIGAPDLALAWLGRYQPQGDLHFQLHLARDPTLDALRTDPRFRQLLDSTRRPEAPQ